MYLFIFEDNSFKTSKEVLDDDKQAVDDGMLDIVDMAEGTHYHHNKWHDIDDVGTY